jgi:hypothetical protein
MLSYVFLQRFLMSTAIPIPSSYLFSLAVNIYASFSPHCMVFLFLLGLLTGHFEHSRHGCISWLVQVFAWNLNFDFAV